MKVRGERCEECGSRKCRCLSCVSCGDKFESQFNPQTGEPISLKCYWCREDERAARECPHGKPPAECNACMVASDHAFDAAREDRVFGRDR